MTEPSGFTDAVARYSSDLDSAVARARRVAAEAHETSAKFRKETTQLAERVKTGTGKVRAEELTDERLRRTASGFRADHGLAVRELPDGRSLLTRQDPAKPTDPGQPGAATESGSVANPLRTTGAGRRIPPSSDDDEDFSQAQIMS
jgi:hypothetical protein